MPYPLILVTVRDVCMDICNFFYVPRPLVHWALVQNTYPQQVFAQPVSLRAATADKFPGPCCLEAFNEGELNMDW